MNYKNDKSVFTYLNQIDTGPLLTKDQERELIKNLEVYQKQILEQLVVSTYARSELLTYLQSLDSSGEDIVDISKKLDDESSKEDIEKFGVIFKALIKELQVGNVESINALLNEVSLTGTILHGVVTEIKKKHTRIYDVESKFNQVRKYFNGESYEVIKGLILSDDETLKARIKSEYLINDVKVNNKLTEWKHIIAEFDSVVALMANATFQDVKDIFKSISSLEVFAQKYKHTLITKNLRLVISRAKGFLNKGLDFEDLIQEGNIGLMKAIDKFDSSKKTKVSTYATWWIDQTIRRAISNKGRTVRVPTHIEWMQTNLAKSVQKLTGKLKRPPTMKELSEESGIELKTLEELQNRAQHEIGIDEELSNGMTLNEMLASDTENPFTVVEQKMLREKIREILATLPPRTEKIIRLRFGIGEVPDDEGTTLQKIADVVGITKQGVRVVECSAFKQLRKKAKGLVRE